MDAEELQNLLNDGRDHSSIANLRLAYKEHERLQTCGQNHDYPDNTVSRFLDELQTAIEEWPGEIRCSTPIIGALKSYYSKNVRPNSWANLGLSFLLK